MLQTFSSDRLLLDYLIGEIRSMDVSLADEYIQKGIAIAAKGKDHKSLAELKTEEAILFNRQGQHLAGVQAFLFVDSLCQILRDTSKLAAVQTNLGLSYYYAGRKDRALEHYYTAYDYHQYLDDPRALSRLLNNLAICYKETHRVAESERFYLESYHLKASLKDSAGMATTLMNLGLLWAEVGRYQEAMDSMQSALALYESLELFDDVHSCKLSLGKIMMDHGHWDRAYPQILDSYQYFMKNHPVSHEALLAAGDMARVSILRQRWSEADKYLDQALALASQSDKLEIKRTLLKDKAQVAYEQQKFQEGFNALQDSYVLNDSLNALSRLKLIEEMQTRFEVDSKEKEIKYLTTERVLDRVTIAKAKDRNLGLLLIGVGLSVFSIILFLLYRRILHQKKVISDVLAERESLLKEIHHRVKNNLQVISSLLSLQSYKIKDDLVLEAIKESRNRVKSMALIHQSLYQEKDLSTIDSISYIGRLTQSLFHSYNIDPDRIKLNSKIEPLQLDVDIMIPLGLILNELISNALKYAFSDGREGSLKVSLRKEKDGLSLEVSDNGVGMPSDYDWEKSHSLGLTLVRDFCEKLQGALKIDVNSGTTVSLAIPHLNSAS